ncbi:hypothetical protein BC777_3780 [Yoonia maricola]|uniref:LysM domain-containing protein n=1 Tax=Yoonia maricola TaxID=420999 RepID=A0A2M8VZY9_9RHOB|nr:hypothetical protein [Yoonia maricola]PJI84240.1 hypothetical protein BC777_3780 [Yoonia maricola]
MSVSFYKVRPSDQVYRILQAHYGHAAFMQRRDEIIAVFGQQNPHIKDINIIRPGQVLALPGAPDGKGAFTVNPVIRSQVPLVAQNLSMAADPVTDALADITAGKLAKGAGGSFVKYVSTQSEIASKSFAQVARNHQAKSLLQISKGQYDGRRIKYMGKYDRDLGALKALHRPAQSSRAVLHVKPGASVPAAALIKEANTMGRIVKTASRGVVILRVASIADTSMQVVSQTSGSGQAKVLAGAAGGFAGGLIGGVAGTMIFGAMIASPVGWVMIGGIMLAGSTSVGLSVFGEELATRMSHGLLYDQHGRAIKKEKLFDPHFKLP